MLILDGSIGEGGGQVLRSALTLSILTGQPFLMHNIRAKRNKPGLMAQHLQAIAAAAAVSKAEVDGAHSSSQSISFQPQRLQSGRYKFEIPTAGSTSLVLQTILLPLATASAASSVTITGGTHVSWSPCTDYLELAWLPALQRIGYQASIKLELAGFYPAGGGRINATIRPGQGRAALDLTQRGNLLRIEGISAVANLDEQIAQRQKRQAIHRLQKLALDGRLAVAQQTFSIQVKITQLSSPVKGTFLLLNAIFEHTSCCTFGLGELGKPAERVADEAIDGLLEFIDSGAAIEPHLADQLLLPLSFSGQESVLHVSRISSHLLTNAQVIRSFAAAEIEMLGEAGGAGLVKVIPHGA
jgi:RNA 3'-terminal phosphate cyclase (ATP)